MQTNDHNFVTFMTLQDTHYLRLGRHEQVVSPKLSSCQPPNCTDRLQSQEGTRPRLVNREENVSIEKS